MKVLWITNTMFPPVCKEMGLPILVTGGWMYSSAQSLTKNADNIQLAVATTYSGVNLKKSIIENITYYLLPLKGSPTKYHKELEGYWKKVDSDFNPDIVHLHGSEFPHGLAYLRLNSNRRTVVSIQGLIGFISRYFYSGMSNWDIIRNVTIRDIVRMDTIWQTKKAYYKSGIYEKEIIQRCNHIIGRTSWDKAQTWVINPKAHYHFCNETLRDPFYEHQWKYENCKPHSIFVSQAGYPVKGLHQLLKAMPLILSEFPDTKIYVAGANIINTLTLSEKMHFFGYGSYIRSLINKLHLKENVIFTGPLNEKQMCDRYLKSNLFICPSSIENSSNSLCEAQLLGMPIIASYVGGIPDMMRGFEEWMYRFEEVEMLAEKTCKIFSLKENVSFNNVEAQQRHNKKKNSLRQIDIYEEIINM